MNAESMIRDLEEKGFVEEELPAGTDLRGEILRMKKEKNAVILAHYYQRPEIQDIADFVGDSLGLSRQAAGTDADIILFAGVHFMAETAKILNPSRKVLIPDLRAGCSLESSCPPDKFRDFISRHPGHTVVTYINCSAEVKAMSDIICTSSNAAQVVASIEPGIPVIFAPDHNLGKYVMKKTGRQMFLWNGQCDVHEAFSMDKINALRKIYPSAKFIAHPESEEKLLEQAVFIGSTSALIGFVKKDPSDVFIVATEAGILHQMRKEVTGKKLIAAPAYENNTCACSECSFMKLNTMEKIYTTLKYEIPEIIIPEPIRLRALLPLQRMMQVSEQPGLSVAPASHAAN